MSAFTEDYKTYTLCYDEGENDWYSIPETQRHPSLKALKAAIDKAATEERRVSKPALLLENSWNSGGHKWELIPVTVTTVAAKSKWESQPTEAWVKTSGGRRKVYLKNLFPDNQETREAFEDYKTAVRAAAAAKKEENARLGAMKRFDWRNTAMAPIETE